MKDFLKMTLAVICGLVLTGIIGMMFCFSIVGSLAAGSDSAPVIPKSGVLKIDMSAISVGEQDEEGSPFGDLSLGMFTMAGPSETIGIWKAVQAVNAAAQDDAVKYIYLKTDGSSTSLSTASELRKALQNFRTTSGKAVVAYMEAPSTGSYYLASVADKIYMTTHTGATTTVNGVSSQMYFLGDILKKLGVNVQLIRHGKYKSAGEMYTRGSSSPENREQYQVMVNSLWSSMASEIAESRSISVDDLNAAIDGLKLCLPQDYVDCGLVDGLLTRTELEEKIAALAVEKDYKDVSMIPFADYAAARVTPGKAKQKIAVVYVNGEIIDGSSTDNVSGDRYASIIEKVRADSTVKAVVLRVNSPGGSVLASEKIKHELDLLKNVKPLVASYGDYAASGGYWISNNCEKIYTDATTLTGSIGVFGMVPDFSKVASNTLHVGVESISSNKHGDMYGLMRPFDSDEYNYMLRSIEDIYDSFIHIVSEGRGIPVEKVDEIGQGRVWTGADALELGLVDEIGTLEDAIRYAAISAGNAELGAWKVKEYPAPEGMMERLMSSFSNSQPEDYSILVKEFSKIREPKIVSRLPYEFRFN